MLKKTADFEYKVPDTHPEAGKVIPQTFSFDVCENDTEAQEVMVAKKIKLRSLINAWLKQNARSNQYQIAALPYKPTEVSQDEIRERVVRDYIRMGYSEEKARAKMLETEKELAELAAGQ